MKFIYLSTYVVWEKKLLCRTVTQRGTITSARTHEGQHCGDRTEQSVQNYRPNQAKIEYISEPGREKSK